jgi:RimJ/RimL family protein N-acetyltransferase
VTSTAPNRAFPDRFDTERLRLRAPRPGDGRAVHDAVVESLAELRAWPASLPWALQEPSPERSEAWCCEGHLSFAARTDLPLLVFRQGDRVLVGATGLHRFDWSARRFEVGWWLRTGATGRGLMAEAVRGVVRFAFADVAAARLECLVDAANQRSRRVAERAGFTLEAIRHDERRDPDGTPRDTCVYARHR